jgi:hypothetical protein
MSGTEERLASADVRQQPCLLGIQNGGNFIRILKIIFRFRKIAKAFNSLPATNQYKQ